MIELIESIKQAFGIDVTQTRPTYDVIWFKYYVVDCYKNTPLEALNMSEASVYGIKRRVSEIQERKEFLAVKELMQTMDPEKYQEYLQAGVFKRQNDEVPSKIKLLSLEQTILQLRKSPKHKLWNKPFNKFTIKDFKTVQKL